MDTEAALRGYLELYLHSRCSPASASVSQALDLSPAAAPGVGTRAVLTTGKLCYKVRQRSYDLVVVDATASGHVVGHLAAPVAVNDLVPLGPVRAGTAWMLEMLADAEHDGGGRRHDPRRRCRSTRPSS